MYRDGKWILGDNASSSGQTVGDSIIEVTHDLIFKTYPECVFDISIILFIRKDLLLKSGQVYQFLHFPLKEKIFRGSYQQKYDFEDELDDLCSNKTKIDEFRNPCVNSKMDEKDDIFVMKPKLKYLDIKKSYTLWKLSIGEFLCEVDHLFDIFCV
jgi:hypothetical protein